ncbi:MAG: DUF4168 domain-containing protein [Gemmatimonadota bacterium]
MKHDIRARATRGIVPTLSGALALLVGGLLLAAPANAQEQQQQQTPPQEQTEDVDVDDEELRAFAEAHLEVQEIREELQAAMQSSENAEEAQALQQEANGEMVEVIQGHDLTTERFTTIVNGINADPELQERFDEIVEELEEEEDDGGGGLGLR